MEILFEVLVEFVLQIVFELFAELCVRSVAATTEKPKNPWLAGTGYFILGAIAGGISLLFLPAHLLQSTTARVINLVLTPIAVGAAMSALGRWRRRRGDRPIRLDSFAYGYVFALAMTVVRLVFGR